MSFKQTINNTKYPTGRDGESHATPVTTSSGIHSISTLTSVPLPPHCHTKYPTGRDGESHATPVTTSSGIHSISTLTSVPLPPNRHTKYPTGRDGESHATPVTTVVVFTQYLHSHPFPCRRTAIQNTPQAETGKVTLLL